VFSVFLGASTLLEIDSPWIEWLSEDPEGFAPHALALGMPFDAVAMKEQLVREVHGLNEDHLFRSALRRFRRRELIKVVYGQCVQGLPASDAAEHLAAATDAIIDTAFHFAFRNPAASQQPDTSEDLPVALFALGALGSQTCDICSPMEIFAIHSYPNLESRSREQRQLEIENWNRRFQHLVELLESFDPETFSVHVPAELRLPGQDANMVYDAAPWLEAANIHGSAMHRVLLLKARPVAGNLQLAQGFLKQSESFVFPRYMTRSEIASLSAFLRKLDRSARFERLATSPCGKAMQDAERVTRQIESLIAFLQLIHGGELPEVRMAKLATAIDALAKNGCITDPEYALLTAASEHAYECRLRLQIQMGCHAKQGGIEAEPALADEVLERLRDSSVKIQQIAGHLRGEVFTDAEENAEESDLILDPTPDLQWALHVVSKFSFQHPERAIKLLQELAVEDFQVLSTRRCRYFLSTIAPKLLDRIGKTPSPDLTLENLAATCRSIGAKGVLWELFRLHQPSMDLYIRLCGASPYLIGILTSNPGMVDELLDSLMLGKLPNEQQLSQMLDELCRGADDIDAIVQSFKNTMHLTIGVRDILGKESISETHRTLANVADVCLQQIIHHHHNALVKRFGVPCLADGDDCRFAVLALGKLGSREPNYHSDVTVLFVYEGHGTTRAMGPMRHHQPISNEFFFHQLAQRVANGVNRLTRYGKLYELQNWLVSKERSSSLAWSLQSLEDYFLHGSDDALQRLLLSTARVMAGDDTFQRATQECVRRILHARQWTEQDTRSVLAHRKQLEESASEHNLKRGPGGTLEVEMLAQLLTLQQANRDAGCLVPGTIDSLEQLKRAQCIQGDDALQLKDAYNFLRGVESGLRLMNTKARHDLPNDPEELARLAYGLHIPDADQLLEACQHYRGVVHRLFLKLTNG